METILTNMTHLLDHHRVFIGLFGLEEIVNTMRDIFIHSVNNLCKCKIEYLLTKYIKLIQTRLYYYDYHEAERVCIQASLYNLYPIVYDLRRELSDHPRDVIHAFHDRCSDKEGVYQGTRGRKRENSS